MASPAHRSPARIQLDIDKTNATCTRMDKRVNDLRHDHRVAREKLRVLEAELAEARAAEQRQQMLDLLAGKCVTDVDALKALLNQNDADAIVLPVGPGEAEQAKT